MKFFSDCSGPCIACSSSGGGCLAGHGDDDFSPISTKILKEIIKTKYHPKWKRIVSKEELEVIKKYLGENNG